MAMVHVCDTQLIIKLEGLHLVWQFRCVLFMASYAKGTVDMSKWIHELKKTFCDFFMVREILKVPFFKLCLLESDQVGLTWFNFVPKGVQLTKKTEGCTGTK